MAGALNVQLGGPASYDGVETKRPIFNDGAPEPTAKDLEMGVAIYGRACMLLGAGLLLYGLTKRRAP